GGPGRHCTGPRSQVEPRRSIFVAIEIRAAIFTPGITRMADRACVFWRLAAVGVPARAYGLVAVSPWQGLSRWLVVGAHGWLGWRFRRGELGRRWIRWIWRWIIRRWRSRWKLVIGVGTEMHKEKDLNELVKRLREAAA